MNAKQEVKSYLEIEPKFRNRRSKDYGLVNLLAHKYRTLGQAIASGLITKEVVVALVQDYATYDRAWRQLLEQNPELRGTDYGQKEELEKQKQIELGYNINHD